jgi:hypothetical protein
MKFSATNLYSEVVAGTWTTTASGNKSFEFDVVGKNPSSFGHTAVIDYVRLIPL